MRHFLIVDIETIPAHSVDLCIAPFAEKLGADKRVTNDLTRARMVREKTEEITQRKAALSPVTARLCSIGVIEIIGEEMMNEFGDTFIDWQKDYRWHFICNESEKQMLMDFNKLMSPDTEFVTFNGRGFDFPFLLFRYGINGLLPRLNLPTYPYNGRDRHHDLMLALNEIGMLKNLDSTLQYTRLRDWIAYFGIDVKKASIAKGEINLSELFLEKKYDEIEAYNRGDCVATMEIMKYVFPALQKPYLPNKGF